MRRYQMLQGVQVPNSSLPSIEITAEGRAMGAIPFWNTMLDPNYVSGGKIRNRAVKATLQENTDGTPPTFGEFPNGERAFSQLANPLNRSTAATDMNPNRWTVFVVQRGDAATPATREVLRTVPGVDAGEFSPRMGVNASGDRASIYNSSSDPTLRLGYTPESNYLNRTVLLMFTFSIERGLAIFENGALVASAPEDVQPLTVGFSAGEYAWYRQMSGLVGMSGLLDADLSAPENAGYRRAIERFLMAKYGIS